MGSSRARSLILLAAAAASLMPPPAASAQAQAALAIVHEPPECVAAGRFPLLSARIEPLTMVVRARVLFRVGAQDEPHAVEMDQAGTGFHAILPAPTAQLASLRYRVVAQPPDGEPVSSPEHVVPVGACASAVVSEAGPGAVQAPAGGAAVPPGFEVPPPPPAAAAGTSGEDAGLSKGAFGFGPATSIAVALAVGAVAVGVGLRQAEGRVQDVRQPVGITLIEAMPAAGSTLRTGDPVSFTIRIVPPADVTASTQLELMQGPAGPVCTSMGMDFQGFAAGFGRNVGLGGPIRITGPCDEVTLGRVTLTGVDGSVVLATGTGAFPDLPLSYRIVR